MNGQVNVRRPADPPYDAVRPDLGALLYLRREGGGHHVTDHAVTHPPINFAELTIDPVRLEKALGLTVEPFEGHDPETGEVVPQPGCYSVGPVSPQSEKQGVVGYWVDLYSHDVPRCDCGDHTYRDTICKHMIACLLHEGNPHVVRALAEATGRLEAELIASLALGRTGADAPG